MLQPIKFQLGFFFFKRSTNESVVKTVFQTYKVRQLPLVCVETAPLPRSPLQRGRLGPSAVNRRCEGSHQESVSSERLARDRSCFRRENFRHRLSPTSFRW